MGWRVVTSTTHSSLTEMCSFLKTQSRPSVQFGMEIPCSILLDQRFLRPRKSRLFAVPLVWVVINVRFGS